MRCVCHLVTALGACILLHFIGFSVLHYRTLWFLLSLICTGPFYLPSHTRAHTCTQGTKQRATLLPLLLLPALLLSTCFLCHTQNQSTSLHLHPHPCLPSLPPSFPPPLPSLLLLLTLTRLGGLLPLIPPPPEEVRLSHMESMVGVSINAPTTLGSNLPLSSAQASRRHVRLQRSRRRTLFWWRGWVERGGDG